MWIYQHKPHLLGGKLYIIWFVLLYGVSILESMCLDQANPYTINAPERPVLIHMGPGENPHACVGWDRRNMK